MNSPRGLGRGLGALIPADQPVGESEVFLEVPTDSIVPNQYQPRDHFDEESLASLTKSVRELGVLQPLLVRRSDDGYELIAGERRWRAAQQASLKSVPVVIREADDTASLEQALVENLHRQDLNPLEEAAAYQQLIGDFGMKQDQVARRVGKSRSAVANTLRLLQLPTFVQKLLSSGTLTAGHARALLGVSSENEMKKLVDEIVDKNLTVRDVESRLKSATADEEALKEEASAPKEIGATRDPAFLELEELLSRRLDTRTNVRMGPKTGKLTIEFADIDDLERIYRVISGG